MSVASRSGSGGRSGAPSAPSGPPGGESSGTPNSARMAAKSGAGGSTDGGNRGTRCTCTGGSVVTRTSTLPGVALLRGGRLVPQFPAQDLAGHRLRQLADHLHLARVLVG